MRSGAHPVAGSGLGVPRQAKSPESSPTWTFRHSGLPLRFPPLRRVVTGRTDVHPARLLLGAAAYPAWASCSFDQSFLCAHKVLAFDLGLLYCAHKKRQHQYECQHRSSNPGPPDQGQKDSRKCPFTGKFGFRTGRNRADYQRGLSAPRHSFSGKFGQTTPEATECRAPEPGISDPGRGRAVGRDRAGSWAARAPGRGHYYYCLPSCAAGQRAYRAPVGLVSCNT